jgi:hypothetical protein
MSDRNATMNRLIIRALRGEGGVVDALGETGSLTAERRERLHDLTRQHEDAARRRDADTMALVDHQLDDLLSSARAEREQAEQAAQQAAQQAEPRVSWDGGVRRSVVRRDPPSMNGTIGRAVAQRRAVEAWGRDNG